MTDLFAVLGFPRRPALDERAIRSAYLEKAARWHPDAAGGDVEEFARIREACDVLSDPSKRLRHLIELEFPGCSFNQPVAPSGGLFMEAGGAIQSARAVWERVEAASSALGRVTLIAEVREAKNEILCARDRVDREIADWLNRLGEQDARWPDADVQTLSNLAAEGVFLQRWKSQLDEWNFRLSSL